ncbi:MAG: hypothetical protein ACR2NL_03700 [Acidimicrobiia bacterium]
MWLRLLSSLFALVLVSSCSGSDGVDVITSGPGADSPGEAVAELRALLAAGDFDQASGLAVPGHAALASLSEGATFGQVAEALRSGDSAVAANFWAGFAQGVGEVFSPGSVVAESGTRTESGVEFHLVGVTPTEGNERIMATQEIEGHRVDLFASFSAGFAGRMISPVEILLAASTDDAALILSELRGTVPSLVVAGSDESLPPATVQEILRLIELITRLG